MAFTLLVGTAVAGAAAWTYTAMLFEPVAPAGYVAMCLLLWISFLVYAAVTFLGSTLARSILPAAGLGIAFLLVLGVLSGLPTIGPWMPASLTAPAGALALGNDPGNVLGPLATSLGAIAIALARQLAGLPPAGAVGPGCPAPARRAGRRLALVFSDTATSSSSGSGRRSASSGRRSPLLAVPLAAALVLGATPAEMGFLAALESLPFVLVSLPAGAWVDRLRRRPVLIAGDLVRAGALLAVPVAGLTGHLSMPVLYAVALVTGTATVFFDIAYMAYLPSLVDRDQLVDGNSKLELSRSAAQFAGPGVGGLLVGWLTAPVAILVDAASFLFSALMLLLIREPESVPQAGSVAPGSPAPLPHGSPGTARRGIVGEIREGVGIVVGNPVLRAIAASISLSNLFASAMFATAILFLTRIQGLGAVEIGVAFGLANLGAIAGALSASRVARRFGIGRTLIVTTLVGSLAILPVPLADPEHAIPALVLGLGVGSALMTAFNVVQLSLRQSITPDHLQGRMNATMRFFIWGVMPIGSLLGGVLATAIGIREGIFVCALLTLTGVPPLLLRPVRTIRDAPPPWRQETAEGQAEA